MSNFWSSSKKATVNEGLLGYSGFYVLPINAISWNFIWKSSVMFEKLDIMLPVFSQKCQHLKMFWSYSKILLFTLYNDI